MSNKQPKFSERVLDHVTETPRSSQEIHKIMCAAGISYNGITAMRAYIANILRHNYETGRIFRHKNTLGASSWHGRCGFYYFKGEGSADTKVDVCAELRALYVKVGSEAFVKHATVVIGEAKLAMQKTKELRNKAEKAEKEVTAAKKEMAAMLKMMQKKVKQAEEEAAAAKKEVAMTLKFCARVPTKLEKARAARFKKTYKPTKRITRAHGKRVTRSGKKGNSVET